MAHTEDVIDADSARTLDGLFRERIRRTPDRAAYRSFEPETVTWDDTTWRQMGREAARWQSALAGEPLGRGDRVAVLMRNRREWVMFEQAALGLGLVVVPLYVEDRPNNLAYILHDSATKLLLAEGSLWGRIHTAVGRVESLQRVVLLGRTEGAAGGDARVRLARDWLPESAGELVHSGADAGALATIVYTSGTTGRPKGVMLSHRNILSNALAILASYGVYLEDVLLSFLPLSHTFERTVGYYVPVMAGATVAYARSVQQLAEDLQAVRPTVMIAVPRVFEKFHARIQEGLAQKPPAVRALFRTAVRVGWRRFQAAQGRARPGPSALLWPLLDRMVARKVRERLGGRTRIIVSGGAPLSLPVARTFIGLGLTLVQGYGLTEASPVVSGNPVDDNDPASVGVALRGVEVRIGPHDELLVRGPGVMLGYWNDHAGTAAAIDPEGWLHTGDQARIERGHIYITGRIKEILVLSNGEKIAPTDVETTLVTDPLFEQAMVVGEGRPYLGALVVLNSEHWIALARKLGLDPFDKAGLRSERLHRHLLARMGALMAEFPGYAKIRRLHVQLEPWTVDEALLTPTQKVRRKQVEERHRADIEAMFQRH
ncbi:MAG: long-chain fatty acid--CoA ligase [Gammaproteobacteria bacterium]|nr:long-chain fatty acid--CoA ligase [Gammaproteobacteria bacterium]NIR99261.1 long-chain fatty acid--CoA ligase [Gammaproteobacteria bacterium]NIT64882.1 long-chain fatty acid--CoA ligase [Gammaproteobacteria bacterium]NIV21832.1 AMP-binding protein [Gammaproteobacteria bacterium]NIX10901.1 AMP-binding protein [Gammaproteobacteria bacterium]